MMSEKTICQLLSSMLPRGRLNNCFESDAEIFELNGATYLFTTDEFSAEDLFREEDPFLLGWNIAAGAVSDIYACGGKPLFYAHALTINENWTAQYLESFGRGVGAVLQATGAAFIGGDCGRSQVWRCTASVIGSCDGTPVQRCGARPGDLVYVTGPLGAGNLEAAVRLFGSKQEKARGVRLPLRSAESDLVRQFASACIDTSDGLWTSLNTLAELNHCGYAVANVPRLPEAAAFCTQACIPPLLLLFGECGEYELLFTVHPEQQRTLETTARENGCSVYAVGKMTASGRTLQEGAATLDLNDLHLQARDFAEPHAYLAALVQQVSSVPEVPVLGREHV